MPEPKLYTGMYATMDNKLIAEEVSMSLDQKSGSTPVLTVPLGFAGVAVGAGLQEFTIETVAPSADFEVNPAPYLKTNRMAEMGMVMSGRLQQFKAFITEATYSHGVGQEPKVVIKGLAPLSDWE